MGCHLSTEVRLAAGHQTADRQIKRQTDRRTDRQTESCVCAGVSLSINVNYISAMPGGEDALIDARVVKVRFTCCTYQLVASFTYNPKPLLHTANQSLWGMRPDMYSVWVVELRLTASCPRTHLLRSALGQLRILPHSANQYIWCMRFGSNSSWVHGSRLERTDA